MSFLTKIKYSFMKHIFLLLVSAFVLGSCGDDALSVEEQFAIDIQLIEDYIKSKNLTAQKTADGIYYVTESEGSAEKPKITSEVTVTYRGYFLDGSTFDSAVKAKFPLYSVIEGWQIGIPKFGRGGKGVLLIPSKYAYGTDDRPGRASAVLAFDIEVFDF
jgi:FKBP-type peptidyl-prolyl cis-trans isomerase FkpA